jgi:hypothetical protein
LLDVSAMPVAPLAFNDTGTSAFRPATEPAFDEPPPGAQSS